MGKTHLLRQFGRQEFPHTHYFNFEEDPKICGIFSPDLTPKRIISELAIRSGVRINPSDDLLIFDEIQECPKALTSLKYFCEDMPELSLCCAGSLLGVKLSGESFPVGKVEFLPLHPMNFEEFLQAAGDEMSREIFAGALEKKQIPLVGHDRLLTYLREYFFTGGMPHIVQTYLRCREDSVMDLKRIRAEQKNLIDSYNKDFAKHSGKTNAMHIVSVFENVPMQLSLAHDESVRRYQFKGVIANKKSFSDLQGPITWLEKAGLVIKVKICNRAEIPLEAFSKQNMFKLFLFDVGLLGCLLDLPYHSLIDNNYGMAKGFFAENFVAQEFMAAAVSKQIYSWTEGHSEIEFLRVAEGKIIPIEVKSGKRTRAKSLGEYLQRYHPARAIKLSTNPLNMDSFKVIWNYPLYLSGKIHL